MKEMKIYLPVKSEVIPLSDVHDYLFSKKIMGEGFAIIPKENTLVSPVNGTVESIYTGGHAMIIKTEEGLNLMIHLGLDTSKLQGKGLCSYVKVGDKVKQGDNLLWFDREYVEMQTSIVTPIVIIPDQEYKEIDLNFRATKQMDVVATVRI